MSVTKIQQPDGSFVNIEHPEGATEESILLFAKSQYDQQSVVDPVDPVDSVDPVTLDTSTFGKGFSRGIDNVQLGYSSALEGIGKVTGIEWLEKYGAESAEVQEKELAEAEPFATRRQDVEDIRSGARFVAETAAEQLPTLGTTLAGVGAGTLVGGPIGGLVGGFAANIPFFYGMNREAQKDAVEQGIKMEVSEGAAVITALPQAALDVLVDRFLIGSGIGKGMFSEATLRTGNIFTRGVKGAGAGTIIEVPTEIGQQILERLQANQDITSDEAISQYIDVGVAAGILGGGARASSSILKGDIRQTDLKVEPDFYPSVVEEAKTREAALTEEADQQLAIEAEFAAAEQAEAESLARQQAELEASPAQKAIDEGKARTRETEAVNMPRMPKGLSKAKPRYASFKIKFANDVDKALYIVQDVKKSASHQKYLQFLRKVYEGKSDAEIRALGTEVKNRIAAKARSNSVDSDGDIALDPVAFINPNQKTQQPDPITTADIDFSEVLNKGGQEIQRYWFHNLTGRPPAPGGGISGYDPRGVGGLYTNSVMLSRTPFAGGLEDNLVVDMAKLQGDKSPKDFFTLSDFPALGRLARTHMTEGHVVFGGDISGSAIVQKPTSDPAVSEAELVSVIEEKVTSRKDESAEEVDASDNDGGNKNALIERLQSGMPLNENFSFQHEWKWWNKFVYNIQDRFNVLPQLEGQINQNLLSAGLPKLKTLQSAYKGEERTHDLIATGAKTFEVEEQNPLAEKITKVGKKFSDINIPALDEFLVLRHAPERNKRVFQRTQNKEKPNTSGAGEVTYVDSSGKEIKQELTNDFVNKRMKSEYDMTWNDKREVWTGGNEKGRMLQGLANDVDKITQKTMNLKVEKGLVSENDANAIRNTFKYYVPLKGHKDSLEDMANVYTGSTASYKGGKSLTVIGNPKRLKQGRTTESVSPMGAIFQDRFNAIQKGHINKEFAVPLLKLAAANPDSNFWEIISQETPEYSDVLTPTYYYVGSNPDLMGTDPLSKDEYAKKKNKKDYIQQVKTVKSLPNTYSKEIFGAKIDGEQVYLDIKNERLMNALLNNGPKTDGAIINSLATINRFLSAINTAFNPEFLGANFAKDVQTAVYNLAGEQTMPGGKAEGQKLVKSIRKNLIPSIGTFYKGLSGAQKVDPITGKTVSRLNPKRQKDFDDFIQSGAKAGWFQERPPQELIDNFSDLQKMASGSFEGSFKQRRKAITDVVEWTNSAVENAARFSVFVGSRDAYIQSETKKVTKEKGKSLSFQEKKAIEQEALARAGTLAKNLTINFNRRGQQGALINSMYLFFNASVQGTANFFRGFTGPKFNPFSPEASRFKQAVGGGIISFASLLTYLNESSSDEDENGRSYYANIPDWEKETSFILMKSSIPGYRQAFPDEKRQGDEGWTMRDEYFKFPLPYGYNVLHTAGVGAAEMFMGTRDAGELSTMLASSLLGSFAPIGLGSGIKGIATAPTPTPLRPVIDLAINKNFFGAPIYKEPSQFGVQLPSSQLSYADTPEGYKLVSEFMNFLGGGNESEPGSLLGISTDISPDALQHIGEFFLGAAGATGVRSIKSFENWSNDRDVEVKDIPFLRRLEGEVTGQRSQQDFYERRAEILQKQNQYKILTGRGVSRQNSDESAKYFKENQLYITVMDDLLRISDTRIRKLNQILNGLAANQNNNPAAAIRYQERSKEIEDEKDRIYDRFNLIFEEKSEDFK